MRTHTALKNVMVSFGCYAFLLIFGLIQRRLLLDTFDLELVAYEGLLSNLFGMLSLVEGGAGTLFSYRILKAFADRDETRIAQLASMYRIFYACLGGLVFLFCVVVFLLSPVLFAGKVTLWYEFRMMFVANAVATVLSYVFGYWQSILIAAQKEYKVVLVNTAIRVISLMLRVIVLWTTGDFVLYIVLNAATNILNVFLGYFIGKKEFSYVKPLKVSFSDFKADGFFKDIRDFYAVRVAGTINSSTDNFMITFLIGTTTTALYGNYILIASNVSTLISHLITPINATVAEVVHQEKKENTYQVYRAIDLGVFFLSSVLFVCFVVVFQPAISVLFGEQYLLSPAFVICLSFQYYISIRTQAVTAIRYSFGKYHITRQYEICGALINLMLSIILGRLIGLPGIVLGTIAANIMSWNGFFLIANRIFFGESLAACWLREVRFALLAGAELAIASIFTRWLPYTWTGLVLCGLTGVFVTVTINLMLFWRTNEFQGLLSRVLALFRRKKR